MKKSLLLLLLLSLIVTSCSKDSIDQIQQEESLTVDLKTFVPDTSFDQTAKGKYVGVLGHHLNREIHGKIYVNVGVADKYQAMVELVNGKTLYFEGKKLATDLEVYTFKGDVGSFELNLLDYAAPEVTNVQLKGNETLGYIVLKKATRGALPFVQLGTYVDSTDPSFYGNWDLIGDGLNFPVSGGIIGTLNAQAINSLAISHGDSELPFVDTIFEPTPPLPCLDILIGSTPPIPVLVDIPAGPFTPLPGIAVAGALQTSPLAGQNASWTIAYGPDSLFTPGGSYYDANCMQIPAGAWSWNGRSGTFTVGLGSI